MEEHAKAWALGLDGHTVGGRYRLGRPIGVGGMGAVFEGVHQAVGRPVAVKLLYPELTQSAEAVRRFQQEAQAAAAIARRGVVDILDFDVDPQHGPYLVMERLKGESLLSRITSTGRLAPSEALAIGAQIADTLAAVHERGIIHRDLKPGNVFLATSEEGEVVKILDFGISKLALTPGHAPLTVPGTVLGTPRYMAPEQASCEPDVDHRADLYSVGLILYHALSGVKPFADVTRGALLVAVIRDGPRPLRFVQPGLPDEVYSVVEQSMEHKRDERFQSAVALGRCIRQVLERLPAPPRRKLSHDEDIEATAIETSVDSTLRSVSPIGTSRSSPPGAPQGAQNPAATISEIPSGRFQALARDSSSYRGAVPSIQDFASEAMPSTVTDRNVPFHTSDHPEPEQPPDTLEFVRDSGAAPRAEDGRSSVKVWVEYADAPSPSDVSAFAGERDSGNHPRYSDPSMSLPTLPRGSNPLRADRRSGPPPTMVVEGGTSQEAWLPDQAHPSRPSEARSEPPKRAGSRWLMIVVVTAALALAGIGGVVLGLYLWNVALGR
jgi:serine/threonine-protein kinase